MFAAPPEQTLEWSDEGVQGAYRFIKRLWKAVHDHMRQGAPVPLKPGSKDRTDAEALAKARALQQMASFADERACARAVG